MIVGIDLGTTNSLIGIWREGAPVLIPNALGHLLTPSAVGLAADGALLVGMPARERRVTHPTRTATAFKRYMGTDHLMFLGDRGLRAEELSAWVLRSLKADAETFLGEPVDQAVITVPAYFNDAQRKATKAAGELAGLEVVRLLTEPTAAALAYGLEAGGAEEMLLVADLGGGTFDVSLLQCFEGVTEVRAVAGDSWLGGEDFVDAIVAAFMAGPGRANGIPPLSSPSAVHGPLRRQAELAMRRLSEADEAALEIVHEGKPLAWNLTRSEFEAISEPVLGRLRAPIERAFRDARVDPSSLSRIILAGGASRMPAFRRLIARLFRRLPAQHIDPDQVVARGAAVAAGMAMRHADLKETVLTDVAPFTLGIEVVSDFGAPDRMVEGLYLPIIERNTVIPSSRMKTVVTVQDNQRELALRIYQGESRFVSDNVLLGQLAVPVPKGPKGREMVDVRFSYDTSGLLEVEAVVRSTSRRAALLVEGNPGILSPSEIREHLAAMEKLKIHPREQSENRAVAARAERLYEERLGDVRRLIGDMLARFQAALEGQDREEIEGVRTALSAFLDEVDDDFFL